MNKTFQSELSSVSGSGGKFFGIECDLEKESDIRNLLTRLRRIQNLDASMSVFAMQV
jgi:hypothetical protein